VQSIKQIQTQKIVTFAIKYPPLPFPVDALFLVGSPVGLFLTVRDQRLGNINVPVPEGEEAFVTRPVCTRMYNVFHPV
jgi:hypothetical protein